MRDYLLLDNRVRLGYVALLCIFLGLILPSIISYYLGEYQADLGNCNPPSRYKSVRPSVRPSSNKPISSFF